MALQTITDSSGLQFVQGTWGYDITVWKNKQAAMWAAIQCPMPLPGLQPISGLTILQQANQNWTITTIQRVQYLQSLRTSIGPQGPQAPQGPQH